ncbi:hypothetical protein MRX96_001374 [Rhipicephalus microplus]
MDRSQQQETKSGRLCLIAGRQRENKPACVNERRRTRQACVNGRLKGRCLRAVHRRHGHVSRVFGTRWRQERRASGDTHLQRAIRTGRLYTNSCIRGNVFANRYICTERRRLLYPEIGIAVESSCKRSNVNMLLIINTHRRKSKLFGKKNARQVRATIFLTSTPEMLARLSHGLPLQVSGVVFP